MAILRFIAPVCAGSRRSCARCKLIVMTDAGFQSTWFAHIVAQGWEIVGRIRGRVLLRMQEPADRIEARDLLARATHCCLRISVRLPGPAAIRSACGSRWPLAEARSGTD